MRLARNLAQMRRKGNLGLSLEKFHVTVVEENVKEERLV